MERKWFNGIETLETLRRRYKELLRKHHPDNGGDEETAKQINAEYDVVFDVLSRREPKNNTSTTDGGKAQEMAFKEVLERVININADIEIIGAWIWIFNGYASKELLKSCGFKWAAKRKAWVWHYEPYHRHHKGDVPLDNIRVKYGSERVNNYDKQYSLS